MVSFIRVEIWYEDLSMNRRDVLNALGVSSLVGMGTQASSQNLPVTAQGPRYSQALINDLPILKEALTTFHPGLFRYLSPKDFKSEFEMLEQYFKTERSLGDVYARVSYFLSTIKCGHTYANFFNQTTEIKKVLVDPANKLPFYFRWIGQKMVVIHNPLSLKGLEVGTIVKKINGWPVAKILNQLLPYVRADGANNDKRRALLEVTGEQGIETFDVYFH